MNASQCYIIRTLPLLFILAQHNLPHSLILKKVDILIKSHQSGCCLKATRVFRSNHIEAVCEALIVIEYCKSTDIRIGAVLVFAWKVGRSHALSFK